MGCIHKQYSKVREFKLSRTKKTKKVVKETEFSPYRGNWGQIMSPETDSPPPLSPQASFVEPATSSVMATTGVELKENKRKRIENAKLQK